MTDITFKTVTLVRVYQVGTSSSVETRVRQTLININFTVPAFETWFTNTTKRLNYCRSSYNKTYEKLLIPSIHSLCVEIVLHGLLYE